MKLIIKVISILLLTIQCCACNDAMAHPGHDHVLNEKQAISRGKVIVSSLIRKEEIIEGERINESWNQATNSATCKETPEYYLIAFDNRAAGKTLYILLTSAGKYLRANFDGQFADLIFSPYPVQSCS